MSNKKQERDEKAEILRLEEQALAEEELAQVDGGTFTNLSPQGHALGGGVYQRANTAGGLGQRAYTLGNLGDHGQG